eukprot:CAMPEP_0197623180 /NCGR_PEP_ID=MMETSP1338-20131121/3235_1 /TAXON_ID=43686 ORGANISM="Pelagodinium beii, Strain RCC1491" /NCGR_SAMPLE_ID=MMETSP1338 /ASSEMBLY_ACC=CAM_ASM_000754 /LENGTH=203 /DNA_ID=CAMNT_0043193065 /DNA_START=37 /DNA_END=648 /DNA_ORIENTATION=-
MTIKWLSLLLPLAQATDLLSSMCASFPVPMMCPTTSSSTGGTSGTTSNPACASSPQNCCQQSSCWVVGTFTPPGGGCSASRGDTTCIGLTPLGGRGACACKAGVCGSSGVCSSSSSALGAVGSTISSGFSNSFGRLYEDGDHQQVVPPEDHSLMWITAGVVLSTASGLVAVVSLRMRPRAEGMLELLPDSDFSEEEDYAGLVS